jgi:hypothetical protein
MMVRLAFQRDANGRRTAYGPGAGAPNPVEVDEAAQGL